MRRLLMCLLVLSFVFVTTGCFQIRTAKQVEQEKRRYKHIADAAATIWEAADALDVLFKQMVSIMGAPADEPVGIIAAIKANAATTIFLTGHPYPRAGITQEVIDKGASND